MKTAEEILEFVNSKMDEAIFHLKQAQSIDGQSTRSSWQDRLIIFEEVQTFIIEGK